MPRDVGRVVSLQRKRQHMAPLEPLDGVVATAVGLEGDRHAGREEGKRQVLLVEAGDLRDLGLEPGDLREQVTVDLPGLMALAEGTRLRIGGATLELTGVCEPCTHIGEHVGVEDRETFRQRLVGRRGMLARVLHAGPIRRDDPVEVETHG
ncbi:MAG: MOSC domain-containing protein [Actinomycetota bacterium]